MSPPGDPAAVVQRFSGPVDWKGNRDLAGAKAFFKFVLRLTGSGEREFDEYVRNAARHYGIALDDMFRASSPMHLLPHAKSQTLVLHSVDDQLVPVEQIQRLRSATASNPNVSVTILPWGNHCLYEMADPDWYWAALARFFEAAPRSAASATR